MGLTGSFTPTSTTTPTLIVPGSAKLDLPVAGIPGRLYRVTDDVRGLWMDQSTQWFGLNGEAVNVKEFGATGGGVTDDTAAIQAAADAMSAAGGGIVFLPPGTYRVSQQTVCSCAIRLRSNITILGTGPSSLIKLSGNQPNFTRVISNVSGDGVKNVILDNFAIDGNRQSQGLALEQQHGVFVTGVTGSVVTRLFVSNMIGDGIFLHGGSSRIIVSHNKIQGVARVGINFAGANHSIALGNTIADIVENWAFKMEADDPVPREGLSFIGNITYNVDGGIAISSTGAGRTTKIDISGNQFNIRTTTKSASAIALRGVDNAVVSGNVVTGGRQAGIILESDTNHTVIANNMISGVAHAGEASGGIFIGGGALAGPSSVSITGNVVTSSPTGLFVQVTTIGHPIGLSITGNIFRANTGAGLVLADSEDVTISGNQFIGNGSHGARLTPVITRPTRVAFVGNTFLNPAGGRQTVAGINVDSLNSVNTLIVTGNTFQDTGTPVKNTGFIMGGFEYALNAGGTPEVAGTATVHGSLGIGGGTRITKHLSNTATWDPASIPDGSTGSTTVTVTGAAVGNTVAVGFSSPVPAGALLVGAVTAVNTVTVSLFNKTGSTLDLPSGTLRADIWVH